MRQKRIGRDQNHEGEEYNYTYLENLDIDLISIRLMNNKLSYLHLGDAGLNEGLVGE